MHELTTSECPMLINALYDSFPTLVKLFGARNKSFILEMAQVISMFR